MSVARVFEADDEDFARRCETMRDADGRVMLDDLAGQQLQRLGAHIADVADALGLTASRIRSGRGWWLALDPEPRRRSAGDRLVERRRRGWHSGGIRVVD